MKSHRIAGLTAALLFASSDTWAGRPLTSDDAGTADVRSCQLESWVAHADNEQALVLAPACGIAEGVELGLDYTVPRTRNVGRSAAGIAVKWVPQTWRVDTAAGELNFGIKFGAAFEHPRGVGWRAAEAGVLGLATLNAGKGWSWHFNLGAARDSSSGAKAGLLNLAVVWAPREALQLFIESHANSRREEFGGTINTAGGRWWLVADRYGVDLTASREAGAGTGVLWTVGFGWYGLNF